MIHFSRFREFFKILNKKQFSYSCLAWKESGKDIGHSYSNQVKTQAVEMLVEIFIIVIIIIIMTVFFQLKSMLNLLV